MSYRTPRWLRLTSLVTATAFTWTSLFALPTQVWAQSTKLASAKPKAPVKIAPLPVAHIPTHLSVPKSNLKLLSSEDAALLQQKTDNTSFSRPLTLLDETVRLATPLTNAQISRWKEESKDPLLSGEEKAKRHLWIGEWELAKNENLTGATIRFSLAQSLASKTGAVQGLARYDTALTQMFSGRYAEAKQGFLALVHPRTKLSGYDRRDAALRARHASACEGYHAERARAGIVEPGKVDPICGAAGLAVALKAHGLPYDQKRVLGAVRVTGRGSNLQDILDGAKKLGLKAWAVGGDEATLKRLPKPLVAFVEHDHFVSVTATDKSGVTYVCADCGKWPGGRQRLTWKQWRLLEASAYAVFAKPGSRDDVRMSSKEQSEKVGRPDLTVRLANDPLIENKMVFIVLPSNIFCGAPNGTTQCEAQRACPNDCPPSKNKVAADFGDPVNLATLQEEYSPDADITVYNPKGPSVSLKRMYQSLRGSDITVSSSDFGLGWSFNYNYGILSNGGNTYLVQQNGSRAQITAPSTPSATNLDVTCSVPTGYPLTIHWKWDTTLSADYYEIKFADRTKIVTTPRIVIAPYGSPPPAFYAIGKQYDIAGNYIQFSWSTGVGPYANAYMPRLNSISDSNGTALITVNRRADYTISSIADRYGRIVYYEVGTYTTTGVPNQQVGYKEITQVSQVLTTADSVHPDRYVYGYSLVNNGESEGIPMLTSLSVPSPTGTGTATAEIHYTPTTMTVDYLKDANGNRRTYSIVDATHTQVTITDAGGTTVSSYIAGFDSGMSETTRTDGKGNVLSSFSYASSQNPFGATTVQDGNQTAGTVSGSTTYTYDQYGNTLTHVSPRGVTTTYTYDYSYFLLGELTQIQEGSKTATSLVYYHGETVNGIAQASGLIKQITMPTPGSTSGGGSTATYSFTYNALGNVLTETTPGNNAVLSSTVTYNYTTDGSYSQTAALRQPLSRTDNLGHTTHMLYDAQGNLKQVRDAQGGGNTTDLTYTIVNELSTMQFPPTTNTSNVTGRVLLGYTYLYPGGPKTAESQYNESGGGVWQIQMTYGPEGEMLTRTGSTQPYAATYDALYRLKSVKDGNNATTNYYYKQRGYLDAMTSPGYTGTPAYNATTDTWGISGKDSVSFGDYDKNGNPLTRTDGRNVVTTYTYVDPESKPTGIAYTIPMGSSVSATPNVSLSYDSYGRTTSVSSSVCTVATTYDDMDKPKTVTTTYPALPSATQSKTLTYDYYGDGSRKTMVTPSGTFTSTYDGAGRQTGLVNALGESFTWQYEVNNWLTYQYTPNTLVAIGRNNRGIVTALNDSLAVGSTTTTLAGYNLGYAPDLTLGKVTSNLPYCAAQSGVTTYAYDNKYQLTGESSTRSGFATQTHAYDYAGNPTTLRSLPSSGSYTYNSDNQRLSGSGTTYDYDFNGNPTTYKGSTLVYDAENRLTSIGSSFSATYRPDGLRASKTTSGFASNVSNNTTNYFVYDGETPLLELDPTGAVYSVTTFGVMGYCARHISTYAYSWFPLFDPSGNTVTLTRSNGTAGGDYNVYDGFGIRTSTGTSVVNDPYGGYGGQSGYYTDWETGLVLCGHRYYDPGNGRWLTRDPIGMAGGVNVYAYCSNHPTMGNDPTGMSEGLIPVPGDGILDPVGPPHEGGGPGKPGYEKPGLGACAGDLMHFLLNLDHPTTAICQLLFNCLSSIGLAWITSMLPVASLSGPVASIVGCLIGAAESLIHSYVDRKCEKSNEPCPDKPSNGKRELCNSIVNALGGCADGIAGVWHAGFIVGGLIGYLEGLGEMFCKEQFGE